MYHLQVVEKKGVTKAVFSCNFMYHFFVSAELDHSVTPTRHPEEPTCQT